MVNQRSLPTSNGPPPSAGGGSSRLALCLIHFVLAIISGWGLKRSTGSKALAAFGIYFGHSLLCLLRHTHPNPGAVQRLLCDKSRRYSSVLFVTLVVGELQAVNPATRMGDFFGADWDRLAFGLWSGVLALAVTSLWFGDSRSSLGATFVRLDAAQLGLCVLWNVHCLWRIAVVDEHWWALGLASLVLLNHFVLWRLPLHYNITQLEVATVGMCFSTIFALNAIQEQHDAVAS
ncbi:LOW QUALITY PROTEIN: uncharacterized protein LOC108095346 [Drosophila ficusphila]|uniref:LOW QUALITY PROTEIN: uncharacterized protein LOC108095346 n=1 Tax=Drosophila ficusphila TaxID=30025 RepID=UPI0007E838C1|nr:LOW QUALITY PROTEIN: uncharacterized protein LOC108095346 [Drosophila ficusphila]